MVRILADGNIVHEDDKNIPSVANRPGRSYARDSPSGSTYNEGMQRGTDFLSSINERLTGYGLPTYTFYGVTLQPLHLVIIVLSVLFFGVHSLFFLGLLFFIMKTSGRNTTSPNGTSNTSSNASTSRTQQSSSNKQSKSFPGRGYSLH